MAQALRFFVLYEALLYFILGLVAIMYLYRFWIAWQEIQVAIYGLEREASQGRLNQAAVAMFILLLIAAIVFSIVTFVVPTVPAQELLATPTLNLAVGPLTESTTLTPASGEDIEFASATPLPTVSIDASGCVPDKIFITAPQAGDTLQGTVEVLGTVNVPNFGYYKFEIAPAEKELWRTDYVGTGVVVDGVLVEIFDTSRNEAGDYVLQLIVDSGGEKLDPCRIPVRIEAPVEEEN